MHVDYWDYIGWKDQFAQPRNAERQRAYADVAGRRSVYTPQMIVNGVVDIVGAKPMELGKAIAKAKAAAPKVELSLTRDGKAILISARSLSENPVPMEVQMVRYQNLRESRITRGENAGRTIAYSNVTEDWKTLREWNGVEPLSIKTIVPMDNRPVVVLIQGAGHGPILAAAQTQ